MTHYYDKEHTKKIEAFFDPCYRTGDYYSIAHLNRNYHFDNSDESYDFTDTLYAVVKRAEGKPIYFTDSNKQKIKLTPFKIEFYLNTSKYLYYFKTEDNQVICYDDNCFMAGIPEYDKSGIVRFNIPYNDWGCYLVSYSFSENSENMKDNELNPYNYKDEEPMTEEEKDIVQHRMNGEPYYKQEEYR